MALGYSPTTGQLASITAPGGVGQSYSYDGFLPTTATWTGPVAGSVGLTYDTDFRVSTLSVNGANPVSYGYDGDGLLTQAGALGIKRDAVTGLLARDSVGSAKGAWSFDNRGALSGYAATVAGSTLFQTGYTRDSLSRITQLVETVQGSTTTWGYEYDDAGRLWKVTRNGTLTSVYGYDLNGNRLSVTGPGRNETGTYDDQDRLLGYNGTTYSYTRAGELQTKIDVSGTTQYQYDFLGNLTRVTLPDATVIEYVIDGQNRRIGKKINGVLTQGWLYQDQLEPVAELDGTGAVVSRFVYGSRSTVPDYLIKGGTTYRVISDHLGSVRLVVDATTGAVAQRLDYDEYGRVTLNTAPGFQPFGYAGGLFDAQTGLVRFGARDYDAAVGRWTVKDPVGFQGGGGNLFAYAGSDPVNEFDPTGLRTFDTCQSARMLRFLVNDLGSNPTDFWPHWPEGHDFKVQDALHSGSMDDLQDYYVVEGLSRPLRSDEFGNFAAGYAAQRNFGGLGYLAVRLGGLNYALRDGAGEPDPLDRNSIPMIDLGTSFAEQERPWSGFAAKAGVAQVPGRDLTKPCGCN